MADMVGREARHPLPDGGWPTSQSSQMNGWPRSGFSDLGSQRTLIRQELKTSGEKRNGRLRFVTSHISKARCGAPTFIGKMWATRHPFYRSYVDLPPRPLFDITVCDFNTSFSSAVS
jgi:hypothetical protein